MHINENRYQVVILIATNVRDPHLSDEWQSNLKGGKIFPPLFGVNSVLPNCITQEQGITLPKSLWDDVHVQTLRFMQMLLDANTVHALYACKQHVNRFIYFINEHWPNFFQGYDRFLIDLRQMKQNYLVRNIHLDILFALLLSRVSWSLGTVKGITGLLGVWRVALAFHARTIHGLWLSDRGSLPAVLNYGLPLKIKVIHRGIRFVTAAHIKCWSRFSAIVRLKNISPNYYMTSILRFLNAVVITCKF